MICPRCGKLHEIAEFTITSEHVAYAKGYRPIITGFLCDGWFYHVRAEPLLHEHIRPVET